MFTNSRVPSSAPSVKYLTRNRRYSLSGNCPWAFTTANTMAAFEAHAEAASVTVDGLGERAGNAPLAEVVMALKVALRRACGIKNRRLFHASIRFERLREILQLSGGPDGGDGKWETPAMNPGATVVSPALLQN